MSAHERPKNLNYLPRRCHAACYPINIFFICCYCSLYLISFSLVFLLSPASQWFKVGFFGTQLQTNLNLWALLTVKCKIFSLKIYSFISKRWDPECFFLFHRFKSRSYDVGVIVFCEKSRLCCGGFISVGEKIKIAWREYHQFARNC